MNPLLPLHHLIPLLLMVLFLSLRLNWRSTQRCASHRRGSIFFFRLLSITCLAVAALNPGSWIDRSEEQSRTWTVLLDRSASMAQCDVANEARFQTAISIGQEIERLAPGDDEVRIYPFSKGLEERVERLNTLSPTGNMTDIYTAGTEALAARSLNKKLAGVFVLSDGRNLGEGKAKELGMRARAARVNFYPLVIGGPIKRPDLILSTHRRHIVSFVEQPINLNVSARRQALTPLRTKLLIKDQRDNVIKEGLVDLSKKDEKTVTLQLPGQEAGYYEYTIVLPKYADEHSIANNQVKIGVTVLASRLRVLIAEGTPSWDTKFLTQLLRTSKNMAVTSIYRLSQDRYFRVATDSHQTCSAASSIFPDDKKAIARYDLVIFGRGVEYFLTPARIDLLKYFVRELGGCVIFSRGKPYQGEFEQLAQIEPLRWGKSLANTFRMHPTHKGESVGLFGDLLASQKDPIWDELPPLGNAQHATTKSFTSILAKGTYERRGRARTIPLVVSRRYGRGMSLVVNVEGLWKWDFFPAVKRAADVYSSFWSQLVTWSATYADFLPGQDFSIRLSEPKCYPKEPIRVRVCRRASSTSPLPDLRILREREVVDTVKLTDCLSGKNQWDLVFTPQSAGTHCLELVKKATPIGPRALLYVEKRPGEDEELSADKCFLEELALSSGGSLITAEKLKDILATPPKETSSSGDGAVWTPLWDNWWLLTILLFSLTTEWFLRRRSGLL